MKKPENTHTHNTISRPILQWISRLVFDPIVRCAYRTRRFVSSKLRSKLSIVELWSGRWTSDRREDWGISGQREFAITPIGVWSNREVWWPIEKVRVNQAPIEVIDRRAVIRSRNFRPTRRPMEFRSTRFCYGVWVHCAMHCPTSMPCVTRRSCTGRYKGKTR